MVGGLIGSHNPPVVSLVTTGNDDATNGQHVLFQLTLAVEVVVTLEDGVGVARGGLWLGRGNRSGCGRCLTALISGINTTNALRLGSLWRLLLLLLGLQD